MEITFIPIDYDYFDFEGRNYAKIIGRDNKDKRVCVIDSCGVYLWAILKENLSESKIDKLIKKIEKIQLDIKGRKTKVEKVELYDKKFLGKDVQALKIFATNYKDLHDIADCLGLPEIEKRRGYDIGFISHYIIEKKLLPLEWYKIQGEVLNNSQELGGIDSALDVDMCIKLNSIKQIKEKPFKPKVLAFDIETDEIKLGEGEILMLSLVSENFKKVITWKKLPDSMRNPEYVEYVKDETELLEAFISYVKKISPDFLVGYFSDNFDLPYLRARAEKNNIKLSLGLDESQPTFSRGIKMTGKISGIAHIDLLKFIRTAYSQYMESETLSLNEVAKEFLQDGKKDFKIDFSQNLDGEGWKKYFEYNLHDSVLTYGLFEKFWPDLLEFTRVMQEPIFDVSRNGMSSNVEDYILHNLSRFNEIPEKRPGNDEIAERRQRQKYQGAFVLEPKAGLYEDVVFFDFTSMHSSIIISFNISKSTLLEKKQKNAYKSPELELEGKKKEFYFSKERGFFPALLKEIFEKRKIFKEQLKKKSDPITKARSSAFKLLANASYGYLGFFGARYYSIEAAASTLAFVRMFNKQTIEKTKKAGFNVIYSDTDSIAFLRREKTKEDVKDFLKKLNSELPGVMHLELEDFYKRGIWVMTRAGTTGAKKKYALIDEQGKLKIRGFETVRRDWCNLARNVQNHVIKLILQNGNESEALSYVKEIINKIKKRQISKEDLIIKTQLKKPISEYKTISPHVIAAKKMEELGIPVSQGNLVEYFIAETRGKVKLVREKVKLPIEKGEYNIEYYLEKQIFPAVENIFQVFQIDTKEIIDGKKQTTLDGF